MTIPVDQWGAWPGTPTLGGHRRGGRPVRLGLGPVSTRSPIAGLVRLGTVPDSAASVYLGSPKPHDALSVSPDSALRTPLRPGRAPHDPVRDARASHRTAGCGHRLGELRRPVRGREAQVARGSHIQTNRARRESSRHLRPFTGGPSRSPRQARRQHNLVTPGRSGRRGGVFLRNGIAPGPPGGRLRSPAGAPSVNIKLFTRRLASLRSVSWSRNLDRARWRVTQEGAKRAWAWFWTLRIRMTFLPSAASGLPPRAVPSAPARPGPRLRQHQCSRC